MKSTLKKEEAKREKFVRQLNGYVLKINKVLSDFASTKKKSILSQEQRVLKVIKLSGRKGVTSDEVLLALPDMPYGSITSKYSSLKKSGLIKCDGRTRDGNSGKQQHIMWSNKFYSMV